VVVIKISEENFYWGKWNLKRDKGEESLNFDVLLLKEGTITLWVAYHY